MTISHSRPPGAESGARNAFRGPWDDYTGGAPRPQNWRIAIRHYSMAGVSDQEIADAVRLAFENDDVPSDAKFAYICGVLKNRAARA